MKSIRPRALQSPGLEDLDLRELGRFEQESASFSCLRHALPERWGYVYTNDDALLRVDHAGCGYLQVDPPGGSALMKPERGEQVPLMLLWCVEKKRDVGQAFANFFGPQAPAVEPGTEPESYKCSFHPDHARYELLHDGLRVVTELWIPPTGAAVRMDVTVTNAGRRKRKLALMPSVRPCLAPFSSAPWDVPHLYQSSAYTRIGGHDVIWMEARNPDGDHTKRFRAAVVCNLEATSYEVAMHGFTGAGSWASPVAAWKGKLARKPASALPYGKADERNAVIGQPIVAAFARDFILDGGKSAKVSLVFGKLPDTADGSLPALSAVKDLARMLAPAAGVLHRKTVREKYGSLFGLRKIETPDRALNRYANEWLPLQLDWVMRLDRGWPTGLRGTRDAAQDATAAVPLDPKGARKRLEEIFSTQRSDGWFVRQYSIHGPEGKHDERPYVDSGIWVWEFLWEYLCQTQDLEFLQTPLRWLDDRTPAPVLAHARRLFEYYIARSNLGKHGLCKIRGGDWNDSVNLAGLEGKGESVMVSCQVCLGLDQIAALAAHVAGQGLEGADADERRFLLAAARLRSNIRKHALNSRGYFNAVFNDDGKWIFSPEDPDGKSRINGPANSFAVIAGVAQGSVRESVFRALDQLRGPAGWRLFHPPIGTPSIAKLGRIGSGDLAPGLAENGTPYNHGSHGFLGRAAWIAGRGGLLHETIRYLLPYDQDAHPVEVSRNAPYGVVNHWREAFGQVGRGGDAFLSGSISTVLRNIYHGMVGFRPGIDGLTIDPCIPSSWAGLKAEMPCLGARWMLEVENPDHVEAGVAECWLDGDRCEWLKLCPTGGRRVAHIPLTQISNSPVHSLRILLGKASSQPDDHPAGLRPSPSGQARPRRTRETRQPGKGFTPDRFGPDS